MYSRSLARSLTSIVLANAGVPQRLCAELEVCSHQASGLDVSRVNGSLAAFRALWQHGVHCYDMDVTALADALLVTHPARLQVCSSNQR